MNRIKVSVERSRTRKRVWLKVVRADGHVEVIQNIPSFDSKTARNKLLDKLSASGEYDEVKSPRIPKTGKAPRMPERFADPGPEK